MKYLIPLIIFGLVGCAMEDEQIQLQQKLDSYAENAALGRNLELFLVGQALESAEQSAELMRSLGYQQKGVAKIRVDSAADGLGSGCLDLTAVRVVNPEGELVAIQRTDRLGFTFSYRADLLIEHIELSGSC